MAEFEVGPQRPRRGKSGYEYSFVAVRAASQHEYIFHCRLPRDIAVNGLPSVLAMLARSMAHDLLASGCGKEKHHRARFNPARRTLKCVSVRPAANVVGWIERGVDAAPPRYPISVEYRDIEVERLPVGVQH